MNLEEQFKAAYSAARRCVDDNLDPVTTKAALQKARDLKDRLDAERSAGNFGAALAAMTGGMTLRHAGGGGGGRSLGAQIVNDPAFGAFIKNGGHRSSGPWMSPAVEIQATTLDESSGSGGQLIVSDYQAGILPMPTRPLVVADLLTPGTTNSNSVTFMAETTATNNASAVAEGGTKPESALIFTQTTELVRKIATWLPVTDEILQDVAQMESYINGRLRLFVQLAEDDQLLNGSGVAPNLTGLMNRSGLTTAQPRGADTNVDAIGKQIAAIQTATNLAVDGIIMHPTNWLTVQLLKDAQGQYMANGGPFSAPVRPKLWGVDVALTTAITLNTALVGAFKPAVQIFRNGGLRVEMSNSHADFFVKNLVAIRAEERLALALYRATALGKVTGLN